MARRQSSALGSVSLQRSSKRQWVLKPQDLAVALKLVALKGRWLAYAQLGAQLHLSQFEVHAAVQRLTAARLASEREGKVLPSMAALRTFVVKGAPFAYPPVRGEVTIGLPTAYAVPPLKDQVLFSEQMPPVWPYPGGKIRGPALLPLYPKLPYAALTDPVFYELLALFDALRMGQARERELASGLLEERLK